MTDALDRLRAAVPVNVRTVCQTLAAAGHEAVTVGGAVRDAILGRTPGDWDIATSATPEDVMALFRHTVPTGLKHGTVTIVTGKGEHTHVEVTTFRGEGGYTDGRRPDHVVFGVPLVDDLARRDLRVNAMAYDPAKHALVDPYGGMRDIEDRVLRAVGPTGNVYEDAVARFTEDGLRVMRAVRFAAQLEFALDPETERGIEDRALASLAKVSRERVSDELRKILATREPSRALRIAERAGIIRLILPALADGFDRWASVRDQRIRVAAVGRWLARVDAADPTARLGAFSFELADPDPTARRLDRAAMKEAEQKLKLLKFSNEEVYVAAALVGAASGSLNPSLSEADLRRYLGEATRARAEPIVALWRADHSPHAATAETILARRDPLVMGDLAITGEDLIKELGVPPGPVIGRVLNSLLERVRDDPTLDTRERLLPLARELVHELVR